MGMKNVDRARIKKIIFEEFKNICVYCMKEIDPTKLTLDHVIPVAFGGRNKIDNIVPACFNCNQKRRHKSLISVMKYRDSLKALQESKISKTNKSVIKDRNYDKDEDFRESFKLKKIGNALQDSLFGKKRESQEWK